MAHGQRCGISKNSAYDIRKTSKRKDVERIVKEHWRQAASLSEAQIVRIERRDQKTGYIALALVAQHTLFEVRELATLEAQLPEASARMEQVDVRHGRKRNRRPRQAIAGFEQGQVIGFAVVGNDGRKSLQFLGDPVQDATFSAVPQENCLTRKPSGVT